MRSTCASGFIDLVDGDDDRHLRRACVVDRLDGLRHHSIIGRDNQHHDIRDLRAAGTHTRERFVTRRIDENDLLPVVIDVICADMLRNPARFLVGNMRQTDRVEKRRLAMVDMTHDRDHRRPAEQIRRFLGDLDILHRLFLVSHGGSGCAELAGNIGREFRVERLVDGGEDAAVHQLLDNEIRLHVKFLGEFLDRDAFRNRDVAIDRRGRGEFAARLQPKIALFRFALAIPAAAASAVLLVILRTPRRLIGRRRRSAWTDEPSGPGSRMHRARSTRTSAGHHRTARAAARHRSCAGARRSLIERLTRPRRLRTQGDSGARRRRLPGHGRSCLLT